MIQIIADIYYVIEGMSIILSKFHVAQNTAAQVCERFPMMRKWLSLFDDKYDHSQSRFKRLFSSHLCGHVILEKEFDS